MTTISFVPQLLFLLGLGSGVGLPLGVPPLPEDPMVARAAPQQCLFYTGWAGCAAPDAKSANQTEQFLAEPEVQRFAAEVERIVKAAINDAARRHNPQASALAEDATGWAKTLLTRPAALFVSSVKADPRRGIEDIHAGAIVSLGDNAPQIKASLEKHQVALLRDAVKTVEIEGEKWYRMTLAPDAPTITWGVKGEYLMVGVGEGELESLLKRTGGAAPAWLAELHRQLPVDRVAAVSYLNLKAIREQFAPMLGPKVHSIVEALGVGNVTALTSVSGLDQTGFISRMLLGIDGEPQGILRLVTEPPLTASDLTPIPTDATVALAARINADKVLETVLATAEKIDPRARAEMVLAIQRVEKELGVTLRNDLLKPLGDTWLVYNSPSEGGLVVTGLTAVVPLQDPQRIAATHAKLLSRARAEMDRPPVSPGGPHPAAPARPSIEQFQFAGREVYVFNAGERGVAVAPAWCLTDKELIVALFPQNIKAYLSRGAEFKSLATVPEVTTALHEGGGPYGLSYVDTRALFDVFYPFVPMLAQTAAEELQHEGIRVDVSIVPSARAIRAHLQPEVTVKRLTKAGIELISRQSLPGSNMGTAGPVAVALLLPAVQAAREAARRAQSMNSLKQIALAALNYENAHGRFPPAYIANKQGKPLLSWRVQILPFLDQQNLYQQFHLDEPWDSEHNKKLIPMMPPVYMDPNGIVPLPAGVTNYLTVRGKHTAFPGKEGIKPSEITDGLSNTIMVVEANNSKAITWTKPEDYEYQEQNPAEGLLGLRPGGFVAVFCDGSVHVIPAELDAETIKALFNRDDGKPMDWTKF